MGWRAIGLWRVTIEWGTVRTEGKWGDRWWSDEGKWSLRMMSYLSIYISGSANSTQLIACYQICNNSGEEGDRNKNAERFDDSKTICIIDESMCVSRLYYRNYRFPHQHHTRWSLSYMCPESWWPSICFPTNFWGKTFFREFDSPLQEPS